jgi:hypothetical protein
MGSWKSTAFELSAMTKADGDPPEAGTAIKSLLPR